MPENPSSKKNPSAGSRLDFSTVAGIALALAGIIGGLLLEKGNIEDIAQVTAAFIVLGGTFGAVLVTTPLPIVLRAFKAVGGVLFEPRASTGATIQTLMELAYAARKNGIISVEAEVDELPDPFIRKAMSLAVDGSDLQE